MTAQNQRDPDGTDILGQVRHGLAELKANVISRWGRVPTLTADPATLVDGQIWVRNDIASLVYRANGVTIDGAFTTTFTPQIDQGATTNITKTVTFTEWRYDGPMIDFLFGIALTGAGTAGSNVTITLPVAASSATAGRTLGLGQVFDASTGLRYITAIESASATQVNFPTDQQAGGSPWGTSPNLALAAGDILRGACRYRWI